MSILKPITPLTQSQVIHREWTCSGPGTSALNWGTTEWAAATGDRSSQERKTSARRRGHGITCEGGTRAVPWAIPLRVLLLGTVKTLFLVGLFFCSLVIVEPGLVCIMLILNQKSEKNCSYVVPKIIRTKYNFYLALKVFLSWWYLGMWRVLKVP